MIDLISSSDFIGGLLRATHSTRRSNAAIPAEGDSL